MKQGVTYLILLVLVLSFSGSRSVYGSRIDSAEVAEEQAIFPVTLADSCCAAVSDTCVCTYADTLMKEDKYKVSLFNDLIKPIVLTGLVGGLLLLIFTQRGG